MQTVLSNFTIMNRLLIFLLIIFYLSCSKSKKEKAFDEFNAGVSISLDAQNEMANGNYELAEKLNKDAISKFENALKIDSEYKGVPSALGHSYYLAKDYQKGIEWYEKAINIDSTMAINHLEYGLCKVNKGDIISGRKAINYAIQLNKSSEIKQQAVYSLFDIGVLAFNYGEQFQAEGENEKGKEFKKFGINVLYAAQDIDSTNLEVNKHITDFTNKMRSGNSNSDN